MTEDSSNTAGKPPHIAFLMPMCWSVRNVIASGLADQLRDSGCQVSLLVRKCTDSQRAGLESKGFNLLHFLVPEPRKRFSGRYFMEGVRASAFQQTAQLSSSSIYSEWLGRNDDTLRRMRKMLTRGLGYMLKSRRTRAWLRAKCQQMYRDGFDLSPIEAQLTAMRPDLLVSTVSVTGAEVPYYLATERLGIPLAVSILSFDNLTSRGELSTLGIGRHYLVWNERMREQLLALYPEVSPQAVTVTGTPQFDFHRSPDCQWSREETTRRLGLPPAARYFLYATNCVLHTPTEPQLVLELTRRMRQSERLADLWLVVRLHPLDDPKRWPASTDAELRLCIVSPYSDPVDKDGWSYITREDQALLVSTLKHSEACLNVSSTMGLDAAILDRPVIGIAFGVQPGSVEDGIYRDFYRTSHYRYLVDSGGLRLATDWAALLALMEDALLHPDRDRRERARMVAAECGIVDGSSAMRVAETLRSLLASADHR